MVGRLLQKRLFKKISTVCVLYRWLQTKELSFDLKLAISGFEIKLLVFCNTEVMNILNTEAKLSLANTRDN